VLSPGSGSRGAVAPARIRVVEVGTLVAVRAATTTDAPTSAAAAKSRATSTPRGCRNGFSECGFQRLCARPRRTLAGGAASGVTGCGHEQLTQVDQDDLRRKYRAMGMTIGQTLTPHTTPIWGSRWPMPDVAGRVRGWPTNDAETAARGVPVAEVAVVATATSVLIAVARRAAARPAEASAMRHRETSRRARGGRRIPHGPAVAMRRGPLPTRAAWPSVSIPAASRS